MATYTPLADATVEAFQWVGDPLADYTLPGWANGLALHAPTDQMLHVPCWNGTFGARIGDWIVRGPTGEINVVSNEIFAASYNVDDVAVDETRKTAEERAADAADLRAKQAADKADAAVETRKVHISEAKPAADKPKDQQPALADTKPKDPQPTPAEVRAREEAARQAAVAKKA